MISLNTSSPIDYQSTGFTHPRPLIDRHLAGSQIPATDIAQPRVPLPIGAPVSFQDGPFAGLTIRAELEELQKADLGRKYGRKDRRPLDPPPVVQMRLFQVLHPGTAEEKEHELDADDIRSVGLVCSADLFRLPEDYPTDDQPPIQPASPAAASSKYSSSVLYDVSYAQASASDSLPILDLSAFPLTLPSAPAMSIDAIGPSNSHLPPYTTGSQLHALSFLDSRPNFGTSMPSSVSLPPMIPESYESSLQQATLPYPQMQSQSVCSTGLPASSIDSDLGERCTDILVGSRIVGMCCVEYEGKSVMLFIFSDLAVKEEGTFLLRYRTFDIFSRAFPERPHHALAERVGGQFKVYSTKSFPGLRASTDLTKHLSHLGVRLNSRERERERRRRNAQERARSRGTGLVPIAPASAEYKARSTSMSSSSSVSDGRSGSLHSGSSRVISRPPA